MTTPINTTALQGLELAINSLNCFELSVPFLVWPVSLVSFVVLCHRIYKQKQIVQSIPLLLSQLNAAFIWSCLAAYEVGIFHLFITGDQILKGDFFGFRDKSISSFLLNAINLEPLNLVLYTWRFFGTLEKEEENRKVQLLYKLVSLLIISLLPAGFYAVFAAYAVELAKSEVYLFKRELNKADYYRNKASKLISTIGYLTIACNLTSCLAMVLVLRLVRKVVRRSQQKEGGLKSQLESNNAVIIAHVVLVSVYTMLSIPVFNVKATNGVDSYTVVYRWDSAWTLVGGVADLFISCTLWIVTDENQTSLAFRQGNRSTLVLNIIRPTDDSINVEFDELQQNLRDSLYGSIISANQNIGDRLISQFFREIKEGPDRDWSEEIFEEVEDGYYVDISQEASQQQD